MYTCSLIQSSNQIEACSKITESEFSANMHICTLCPRYQQILPKFGAAVQEELRKQTVHYEIQYMYMAKIQILKGLKFTEK